MDEPRDMDPDAGPHSAASARSAELALSRLHLRMGAFALARAELETLAGSGALDADALVDLAEIRWRTDDLAGAGEAAAASLAGDREDLITLVIAAEAMAAVGRPAEARRLAARALERADRPLDAVFAGIAPGAIWPHEPVPPIRPALDESPGLASEATAPGRTAPEPPTSAARDPVPTVPIPEPTVPAPWPGSVGASSAHASVPPERAASPSPPVTPPTERAGGPSTQAARSDAAADLAAAREAIAGGRPSEAAIRLSLVLRAAPALAPAVLDIAAAVPGPEFDLIRGDALRLVGRENEARRAYASATERLISSVDRAAAGPDPEEET